MVEMPIPETHQLPRGLWSAVPLPRFILFQMYLGFSGVVAPTGDIVLYNEDFWSVAWLARSKAWLAGSEAWLAGP